MPVIETLRAFLGRKIAERERERELPRGSGWGGGPAWRPAEGSVLGEAAGDPL